MAAELLGETSRLRAPGRWATALLVRHNTTKGGHPLRIILAAAAAYIAAAALALVYRLTGRSEAAARVIDELAP